MKSNRVVLFFAAMLSLFAGFAPVANAALDAGVTTALTAIQTDGLALIAAVTVVVIAFIAPGVIIKLIKRFSAKV